MPSDLTAGTFINDFCIFWILYTSKMSCFFFCSATLADVYRSEKPSRNTDTGVLRLNICLKLEKTIAFCLVMVYNYAGTHRRAVYSGQGRCFCGFRVIYMSMWRLCGLSSVQTSDTLICNGWAAPGFSAEENSVY